MTLNRIGAQRCDGVRGRRRRRRTARVRSGASHGRGGVAALERAQERTHLEARVQLAQRRGVRGTRLQRRFVDRQLDVAAYGRELARQRHHVGAGAQVFTDLTGDLGGVFQDRSECAVGIEPLGGGLRPHLVDARDVVGAVADQREVIDDLLGVHVELCLDAVAVEEQIVHGVDERDALVDELRHVLVAGRDQHLFAGRGGACRQRADHIVRLDAGDAQQRQAHAGHRLQERFDLRAQVVGHGRAVRLVLREQIVAKGPAGRVEHHHESRARVVAQQFLQHVEHAVHRAGGLAPRGGQRRQRVEGPVEIGRAVDEDQVWFRRHWVPSATAV